MPETSINKLLAEVAQAARKAGVFDEVTIAESGELICAAKEVDAEYVVSCEPPDGQLWVVLRTPDRWLSESIEADLMHTGDKLEELIEDELLELGESFPVRFEHYRDDEKRYVFRTPSPTEEDASQLAALLLAYEAAFGQLGDMGGDEAE